MHLRPDVSLCDEASIIASPVAACPSGTLVQELDVVLKGCLNLGLPVVLNPCLPLLRDQPASHEIIVVRIELILTPALSLEAFQEQRALQNIGAKGARAARHAGGPSINPVGCRDLEVSSLNVCSPQPVVNSGHNRTRSDSLDSLTRANASDFRIFEWSQQPGQNCARPRDIVVCHDYDGRLDLRDGFADLDPLVCNWDLKNSNIGGLESLCKFDKLGVFAGRGDQEQFEGVARENALQ